MNDCWAIVVAAGRGTRAGLPFNKAFYRVRGRTVLEHCIDRLEAVGCFDGAIVVLHPDDMDAYRALTPRAFVKYTVAGGTTRQASVYQGLLALPETARIVAVHDAARMFVPANVVLDTVRSAARYGSGVAATVISDTVKRVDRDENAVETLDRDVLRAVQTPQTFSVPMLLDAHRRAVQDGYVATDDAALVEKYHGAVRLCVSGEGAKNRKLTTREDIMALAQGQTRVGYGFDAHRLVEGRNLTLLGVTVPYERGLLGHSDADVAAHAVMDALLGALAMGDIGQLFPDSDPAYKDICSMLLVARVGELLAQNGYRIGNIDITITAQAPKLAPYRDEMRARLAQTLGLDVSQVSCKATTTERMGYEGRGEGISAACVALITKD